ncbi:MAG TPA: toxin HipA [Bacteroidetes bacterium]|nr:toxin HipA [Bacteroidota bacterium]HAE35613.1 toxin HipA [Bacteroidota bacterium]HPR28382.1 type II toxin-antitoxin system HipA family toxin [Chitinophagales bacterium]HQU40526.1 type II toxin-antitoxin system HipA family toxin [Chitinophagales bacterium]HQU76811.1 type II toxin-antitoxin system HipA family toxin [Chitinophagales bacterium]
MIKAAYVNIWNKRVGAVAWNEEEGIATFRYDPEFLETGLDLSPVMMPLNESLNYRFPEHRNTTTFKGLPGMLADVLPDKYGNALINQWLVKHNRPANSINPVETLCFIGKRAMGALEFEPSEPKITGHSIKLEMNELIDITSKILSGRQAFLTNLQPDQEKALQAILKIGTSAGGARAKALIEFNKETKEIRSGQANAPKGFDHYLIKFDGIEDEQFGTSRGYGRVEMAYYKMAVDAGIEMMESELLEENGRAHFMTKRFDRVQGKGKIHVQSFCAMRHYDFKDIDIYSYEDLFETMRLLVLPYPQAEQLFRRMVFNVIARNCDDHTKNFAFTMDKSGEWSLSPAFDVCHAYRPSSTWVSQHCLSVNGKRKNIERADLLEVARKMNIKGASEIIDQVDQVIGKWKKYADDQKVDPELREAIKSTFVRMNKART